MIKKLHIEGTGPASLLELFPGERLNLITGDNGLGKTFLLDIAWWALAKTWAGSVPSPRIGEEAKIAWELSLDDNINALEEVNYQQSQWAFTPPPNYLVQNTGLVIYARVDGGISIRDPLRNDWAFIHGQLGKYTQQQFGFVPQNVRSYHFTPLTLWEGLYMEETLVCNGLLNDWIKWQYQPKQTDTSAFQILQQVLETLSPDPDEKMEIGDPVRLFPYDARDYPTLKMPYGLVPVVHASAGMKRIISLAYALVWAWAEHQQAAQLLNQAPSQRMVLLFDEVEAHLHPRWQRSILPSLLKVVQLLDSHMQVQILATTHAPLVLASAEPWFKPQTDRLYLFQQQGSQIQLEELPWAKQGDATGWLLSEVFGLEQARSLEAEKAIEAAEAWMRDEKSTLPSELSSQEKIHAELLRVLAGHDPFWPRWIIHQDRLAGQV